MTTRAAFISGCGKNIGRVVGLKLAAAGVNIVVNGRFDQSGYDAVAGEVCTLDADPRVLMGDVG